MIQKFNKSQINKTNLVNNDNNTNNNNKKVIDAISVKLKNNQIQQKDYNSKINSKSKSNDSNDSNISDESFQDMLLHSDRKKIELFKKNKLKELKNKAEQENYKFTNKPLSEIDGLITELTGLFAKPTNIETQFANDSKDKFIDFIFDNFEDLIESKEEFSTKDISINNNTNTNIKEFNPDNYDVLNPLSELSNNGLIENKQNKSETVNLSSDSVNIKDESLPNNNVLSETNNPKNLKYNLKDLISLIKNAIENDNNIQKSEIVSNINSILISQAKDNSLKEISHKRISDLVSKNTNEMVNEFLPKYFFKSGNQKNKNISQDINNLDFKINQSSSINNDFDNYINEIGKLEQKLNKINEKSSLTTNNLSNDNKKHNIILTGENKPTNEIKTTETKTDILVGSEKIKENKIENSDKTTNFNQNLNLDSNKNTNVNNIVKRSNLIEFQSFNDVSLNELNSTTTNAAVKTPDNTTSMVRITMNPNSLGTVFVEIKMEGDEASINFKSADKEVLSTLENNIKDLQVSLKNENIELKSLIIDYKDYEKELNQENSARNQEEQNNKDKKQENKNLYKDLSKNQQEGISLDPDFYNNLKNYAEQFRESSNIYKDVTNRNSNLETLKIKTKIIEKYS